MRVTNNFSLNHEYDDNEYTFVRRWVKGNPIAAYLLKRGQQINHCHVNECSGVCILTPLQLFGRHIYMGKKPNRVINESLYETQDALMVLKLVYVKGIVTQAVLKVNELSISVSEPCFHTKNELLANLIKQLRDAQNIRFNEILNEISTN